MDQSQTQRYVSRFEPLLYVPDWEREMCRILAQICNKEMKVRIHLGAKSTSQMYLKIDLPFPISDIVDGYTGSIFRES